MSRVEEIQAAIDNLPPEDYGKLAEWFRARENAQWDQQMDRDSETGRLDALFEEAEAESCQGRLREWPPRLCSPVSRQLTADPLVASFKSGTRRPERTRGSALRTMPRTQVPWSKLPDYSTRKSTDCVTCPNLLFANLSVTIICSTYSPGAIS
jgi:hypothetical protein